MGKASAQGGTWDAIVIGAGLIGLAVARELNGGGLRVLLVEQGEAGREASWAGAGMLAAEQIPQPSPLRLLALASARMYAEYCAQLRAETGQDVEYRQIGTLAADGTVWPDHCVDNRRLVAALRTATERRGITLLEHTAVSAVSPAGGGWCVRGGEREWVGRQVVNAAGAWAGQIAGAALPVRPRKGQILAVQGPAGLLPRVRMGEGVYLVPRGDGRIVIGATMEDVGFSKALDPRQLAALHARAVALAPAIAGLPVVEQWAGLRPGTPDDLPLLGAIAPGLWAAAGHFRDGILLAPVTAKILAALLLGVPPDFDLKAFAPLRFGTAPADGAPRAGANHGPA